jgi:hypothetical protein
MAARDRDITIRDCGVKRVSLRQALPVTVTRLGFVSIYLISRHMRYDTVLGQAALDTSDFEDVFRMFNCLRGIFRCWDILSWLQWALKRIY